MEKELLEKLINHALKLLARRGQTEGELRDKLTRYMYKKKIEEKELYLNEIVDFLKKKKFLDDEGVAGSFVRDRQLLKPRSKKMLRLELQKKRIAPDLIEKTLEEYDEEAALRTVIEKKGHYSPEDLLKYLLSQGFPYDLIKDVVSSDGQAE